MHLIFITRTWSHASCGIYRAIRKLYGWHQTACARDEVYGVCVCLLCVSGCDREIFKRATIKICRCAVDVDKFNLWSRRVLRTWLTSADGVMCGMQRKCACKTPRIHWEMLNQLPRARRTRSDCTVEHMHETWTLQTGASRRSRQTHTHRQTHTGFLLGNATILQRKKQRESWSRAINITSKLEISRNFTRFRNFD